MHEMFRELLGKYAENRSELAKVKARLAELLRTHYGRSSEKLDESQYAFSFEEVQTGLGAVEAKLESRRPSSVAGASGAH